MLAIKFQGMLDRGEVKHYAELRGWGTLRGHGLRKS